MKVCFVLEGGALRGLYTSGVLDYLYEKKVNIDVIIGVSSGALFGVNYFSNQPYRVLRYNKKYSTDKRYISVASLLLTGNLVNKRYAYYKVTKKLDPFDQETFVKNNKEFYAVASNIETGKAEYIRIERPIDQLEELRASSAMPLYSRIIKINDKKYLDGAVCDSIPVKKAIESKYDKVVVVLTQPENYQKKGLLGKNLKRIKHRYRKYPKFIEASVNRAKMYNDTLDYIKKLEKDKRIFVIRPSEKIDINPIKKTKDDLQRVYDIGRKDIEVSYKDLLKYLKQ